MFLAIGRAMGHEVRKSFSSTQPGDGVWLEARPGILAGMPMAAIEVLVSEGAKEICGSVHRLEAISPVLGVIVVQEDEITRRLTRLGLNTSRIETVIANDIALVDSCLTTSKQRIQRWSFAQLKWVHNQVVRQSSSTLGALLRVHHA
ncbi:MAG TPA: hypothetical protein VF221_16415 [Chloroflexota bacterium]